MTFSLDAIQRGCAERPPRVTVYGPPGVGKSTWAAGAPKPIFIQTEDGADQIGVDRFPLCRTFDDAMECLRALGREGHDYQTVVLDSADWLERLAEAKVAADYNATSIDDTGVKAFGYGKGRELAASLVSMFVKSLDWLRDNKDMAVIIIGHSEVKRFDNPLGNAYDRYQPRLYKASLATVIEWSDALLFAGYETFTRTDDTGRKDRVVGVGDGRRILYTDERPGHLAKNRYSLAPKLDLTYAAFDKARREYMAARRQEGVES